MLADPMIVATTAAAGLIGLGMVTGALLTGWRGWLHLKAQELQALRPTPDGPALPNASARIEIADLKERIRKLEAIAAGVEL